MKKAFAIANWKMKLTLEESLILAKEFESQLGQEMDKKEIIICPSFTALSGVSKHLVRLKLGGQNVAWETEGSFTGEVSSRDLISLGSEYCIVGHSERRLKLGETEEMIAKKVSQCVDSGLKPILCIGETWEEFDQGQRDVKLMRQIRASFEKLKLKEESGIIIAYEPIWAIGTGKNIEPKDAFMVADLIRHALHDFFSENEINKQFSIVYGGSVTPNSTASYFAHDSIEGVLVGGASLKIDSFRSIISSLG